MFFSPPPPFTPPSSLSHLLSDRISILLYPGTWPPSALSFPHSDAVKWAGPAAGAGFWRSLVRREPAAVRQTSSGDAPGSDARVCVGCWSHVRICRTDFSPRETPASVPSTCSTITLCRSPQSWIKVWPQWRSRLWLPHLDSSEVDGSSGCRRSYLTWPRPCWFSVVFTVEYLGSLWILLHFYELFLILFIWFDLIFNSKTQKWNI